MRNQIGLTKEQIDQCKLIWKFLMGGDSDTGHFDDAKLEGMRIRLDTSEAHEDKSRTRFNEDRNIVILGADAFPGTDITDPNSQLSESACLIHELSHAQRYYLGFRRPCSPSADYHPDEAETSLHASFHSVLYPSDRLYLVEDAQKHIRSWLREKG
ncbi:hypothetical protein QUF72_03025 [Desulfobacterales bacterium HSG2]|nr:hypothetical protein [Desulfobacterales bacterium HSG2]